HGASLHAPPAAEGTNDAAGRNTVRRRAADARGRPRAHEPPEAPHARRAVARSRADPRGHDLQDDRRDQRRGDADPPRGAERGARARGRPPRVRARDGQRRAEGHRQGAAQLARRAARLPRDVTQPRGVEAFYRGLDLENSALIGAIKDLTPAQLALEIAPDWPIWA